MLAWCSAANKKPQLILDFSARIDMILLNLAKIVFKSKSSQKLALVYPTDFSNQHQAS